MPKGTCNPSPDPYNIQRLTKGNGDVQVEVRYGWDGVSVWPNCAGPIIRVFAQHTGPPGSPTWYCKVPLARGGSRTIAIVAGAPAQSWSGAALATVGLVTLNDIADLTLTTTP